MKLFSVAALMLAAACGPAIAHDVPADVAASPPAAPFAAVSSLVKLPDFLPGMGQLFVDPATLPAGPFLAYDHDGKLVLGALAIGGPKMKVHKTCVRRLFESNDQVLDTDAVYAIAKELV